MSTVVLKYFEELVSDFTPRIAYLVVYAALVSRFRLIILKSRSLVRASKLLSSCKVSSSRWPFSALMFSIKACASVKLAGSRSPSCLNTSQSLLRDPARSLSMAGHSRVVLGKLRTMRANVVRLFRSLCCKSTYFEVYNAQWTRDVAAHKCCTRLKR
jgi:hypothetical protein